MKYPKPSNSYPVKLVRHMAKRYTAHLVGLESAALAFYLIFAVFPFLILITMLLGVFQMDLTEALDSLSGFLPREALWILRGFLQSAARPGGKLAASSLALSLYFPMRAANSLMYSVRRAYHLGAPRVLLIQAVKTFLFTILLMAAVVVTVALMTVSNRILAFGVENLGLPPYAAELWAGLRFPVSGIVAYFALYFLYALAQDGPRNWRDLWPGAMAALGGWLAVSWGYAMYVNHVARYSLLFGSIGTVIVLLIWLNLTATVLILGAELNGSMIALRRERDMTALDKQDAAEQGTARTADNRAEQGTARTADKQPEQATARTSDKQPEQGTAQTSDKQPEQGTARITDARDAARTADARTEKEARP